MSNLAQSAVALGGGHGLYTTLRALRRLLDDLTIDDLSAVVTVADNGGSSGRLRDEFPVVPPGDLRMALAALCGEDDWGRTWERLAQHRFGGSGQMHGHAVGNLLIVGLWELFGDPVAALDLVGQLLRARGRVLPMATEPLDIHADVRGLDPDDPTALTPVTGQVEVATTPGHIARVALSPAGVAACPEAVAAVEQAEWVFLGPGSWFSSVVPHLLLPGLRDALVRRGDRLVLVLNVGTQDEETSGYSPASQLRGLAELAPGLRFHTVLADPGSVGDADDLAAAVAELGGRLVVETIADPDGSPRHDVTLLSAALARVMLG